MKKNRRRIFVRRNRTCDTIAFLNRAMFLCAAQYHIR